MNTATQSIRNSKWNWIMWLSVVVLLIAIWSLTTCYLLQRELAAAEQHIILCARENAELSLKVEATNARLRAQGESLGQSVGLTQRQLEEKSNQLVATTVRLRKEQALTQEQVGAVRQDLSSVKTDVATSATAKTDRVVRAVYNTLISPTLEQVNTGLLDHVATTIDFYIGKPNPHSVQKDVVNDAILRSASDMTLNITLACGVCEAAEAVQHKLIVYKPATGESTHAMFRVTPDALTAASSKNTSNLSFQVTQSGYELNNIVIPVTVSKGTEPNAASPSPVIVSHEDSIQPTPETRPVDLSILVEPSGAGPLTLTLFPGPTDEIRRIVNPSDASAKSRSFVTELYPSGIANVEAAYYGGMYAVVEDNSSLRSRLEGHVFGAASKISPVDEDTVIKQFLLHGKRLYDLLFRNPSEPDLIKIVEALSRLDLKRPIRIRVDSGAIFLPWQILHDSNTADPDQFWGFKYEISLNPLFRAPGEYPTSLVYGAGPLLFGEYRSADAAQVDEVSRLAAEEAATLREKMGFGGLVEANSLDKFEKSLKSYSANLAMIVTFTHAENGTFIDNKPTGPTSEQTVDGAKLKFSMTEWITSLMLEEAIPRPQDGGPFKLTNRPLVILNGCETGVAGFLATDQFSFQGTLLRLGARGVIVTEAPVWDGFAFDFSKALIMRLKNGESASGALLATRKDFLDENNPLGLLYSYYGGPDVSVRLIPVQ